MAAPDDSAFVEFVEVSQARLLTAAWMLTGDPSSAEELVQEALERVYLRWRRLRDGNPEGYARRIVANLHTDRWRRRRREVLTDRPPEPGVGGPGGDLVDLTRALQALPTRERQCVVLRHYLDLSERDTAQTLGVSLGTVKSSTSRGLERLRDILKEDSHA